MEPKEFDTTTSEIIPIDPVKVHQLTMEKMVKLYVDHLDKTWATEVPIPDHVDKNNYVYSLYTGAVIANDSELFEVLRKAFAARGFNLQPNIPDTRRSQHLQYSLQLVTPYVQ
jgi:hypothetical protein